MQISTLMTSADELHRHYPYAATLNIPETTPLSAGIILGRGLGRGGFDCPRRVRVQLFGPTVMSACYVPQSIALVPVMRNSGLHHAGIKFGAISVDDNQESIRVPFGVRTANLLDRAEIFYLRVLRAAVLLVATILIGYTLFLSAISLYRVSRSPDSVKTAEVSVAPNDIISAESVNAPVGTAAENPKKNSAQIAAYQQFVTRYYQLFRTKFEPYRQPDDKQLSLTEFDDNFVGSTARLAAISNGNLNFAKDLADLKNLNASLSIAADLPEAKDRLQSYRSARKAQVCRSVEKTRTTIESGWNSASTSCASWYTEPVGCPESRPVETPYTTKECAMKFPEGTQSHIQLFRNFQDRYNQLLSKRRQSAAATANAERLSIVQGIARGRADLFIALLVAGAFVVLMFFFLMIAIERHQRRFMPQITQGPVDHDE